MASFLSVNKWIHKFVCACAFMTMAVGGTAYSADTCTAVVGNLVGPDCGFDVAPSTWIGFSTRSFNTVLLPNDPGGVPYAFGNLQAGTQMISPSFQLNAGNLYNISFYIGAQDPGTITGVGVQLVSSSATINLVTAGSFAHSWNQVVIPNLLISSTDLYKFVVTTGSCTGTSCTSRVAIDSFVAVLVPEPTTMLLLGSLCSAVVGYKYRRNRAV